MVIRKQLFKDTAALEKLAVPRKIWVFLGFVRHIKTSVYSLLRASLIAQLVKNPPAMQETLVQFLGQEDPLEKGQATHSSILGLSLWLSW